MSYDEKLAQRIREILSRRKDICEKQMFGGLALMLNGHMFCGIIQGDLMVRVGPEQYEAALTQPHVRPMDFTGRPLNGYVYVAPAGYKKTSELAKWVQRGMTFVSSLPAKKSRVEKAPSPRRGAD